MFYEYSALSSLHGLGIVGVAVFVGIHALLNQRIIGGDGLVFFAGNTLAATLVLASNFGGVHVAWLCAQIVMVTAAMLTMIARFFETRMPD